MQLLVDRVHALDGTGLLSLGQLWHGTRNPDRPLDLVVLLIDQGRGLPGGGGRIAGVLVDGLGGRQLHWLVGNDELALQVAMGDDTDAPCRNSVMVVRTSFPVTA